MDITGLPLRVRIGGVDKGRLREALRDHGVQLNTAATALFDDPRFVPSREPRLTDVVALSVAELGFDAGAVHEPLTARARECGLVECPLELGAHLRLQCLDQAEGAIGFPVTQHQAPPGSLTIASVPLDHSDETPKGFYLRRIDGTLWLRGYRASADNVWRPDDVLVFARERPGPIQAR